jgi:hypothetical protein
MTTRLLLTDTRGDCWALDLFEPADPAVVRAALRKFEKRICANVLIISGKPLQSETGSGKLRFTDPS